MSKAALRSEILALLRGQEEGARIKKSRVIQEKLFALPEFQRAQTVLFYASFDGEVDTFEMIKQAFKDKKTVALPIIIKETKDIVPCVAENFENGLITGPYGIKQPDTKTAKALALEEIDLAVVPGVAFDRQNRRLGRGQGFYDRFLSRLPSSTPSIGLAFDFQIVENLPELETHDFPVTRILSN